jgi:hypothetical protein
MNEMVERVAGALFEAARGIKWEYADAANRGGFLTEARAAIATMREPTEAMIDECPYLGCEAEGSPTEIWQAMIDAAMKEE